MSTVNRKYGLRNDTEFVISWVCIKYMYQVVNIHRRIEQSSNNIFLISHHQYFVVYNLKHSYICINFCCVRGRKSPMSVPNEKFQSRFIFIVCKYFLPEKII